MSVMCSVTGRQKIHEGIYNDQMRSHMTTKPLITAHVMIASSGAGVEERKAT